MTFRDISFLKLKILRIMIILKIVNVKCGEWFHNVENSQILKIWKNSTWNVLNNFQNVENLRISRILEISTWNMVSNFRNVCILIILTIWDIFNVKRGKYFPKCWKYDFLGQFPTWNVVNIIPKCGKYDFLGKFPTWNVVNMFPLSPPGFDPWPPGSEPWSAITWVWH